MTFIQKEVTTLIQKYRTNDPFLLAECLNIHVLFRFLHQQINGFYKYEKRNKYIVINKSLSDQLQKFVCAHELGHAVLHKDINTPFMRNYTFFSVDKIEVEANTFAVELLMPNSSLYELQDTNLTIYEAAELYGVPKEVCHLKEYNFF